MALKDFHLLVRRSDGAHSSSWQMGVRTSSGARAHHFAPVGLGWMVFGELSAHGVAGVLGRVNAPGPTLPGEVVTLRIEVGEAHRDLVELTGIAVTEDGSPLGRLRQLEYSLGSGTAELTAGGSVSFDERGRWSVQIPRTRLDSPLRLTHRSRGTQPAVVSFESPDAAQEVLDVGTVTFLTAVAAPVASPTPAPTPLARGRVVDADGAPLKGVSVSAWGRARSLHGAEVPSEPLTRLASTSTDAGGSYELAAVTELMQGTLRISAHHPEFVRAAAREVTPRATDVDFVLTRGATLALVLQVEPALLVEGILRFGLRREDTRHDPVAADGRERARIRDTNPDGVPLRFVGLSTGQHTFAVDLGEAGLPLFELDVGVAGDTDLGTVDVRGRMGVCYLRLSTSAGEPVVERGVEPRDAQSNASVPHHVKMREHGRLTLLAPLSVGDLVLDCGDAGRALVPRALLRPVADADAPVFTPLTVQ